MYVHTVNKGNDEKFETFLYQFRAHPRPRSSNCTPNPYVFSNVRLIGGVELCKKTVPQTSKLPQIASPPPLAHTHGDNAMEICCKFCISKNSSIAVVCEADCKTFCLSFFVIIVASCVVAVTPFFFRALSLILLLSSLPSRRSFFPSKSSLPHCRSGGEVYLLSDCNNSVDRSLVLLTRLCCAKLSHFQNNIIIKTFFFYISNTATRFFQLSWCWL